MELARDPLSVVVGLAIGVGFVQCFFGYRLLRPVLAMTGFVLGGGLAALTAYAYFERAAVALVAGLLGGAVGTALMLGLFFLGLFALGAVLGVVVGIFLLAFFGADTAAAVVALLALGGGVLALLFRRLMIIFSTAFGGSWHIVSGLAHFGVGGLVVRQMRDFVELRGAPLVALFLVWLALGAVGFLFQYRSLHSRD